MNGVKYEMFIWYIKIINFLCIKYKKYKMFIFSMIICLGIKL